MTGSLEAAERYSGVLVLVLAALGTWFFLAGIAGHINFRYAFEYGEPVVMLPVLNMKQNPWIYGDLTRLPHLLMPYNPLYVYLSYLVSLLTGANYICGRAVAAVVAVISAVLIALICRRRAGVPRAAAMAMGLVFLASPFVLVEATHVKPDFMALTLALTAFYLGTGIGIKNVIGAAVFAALAFLTKQDYVLAALAVGVYLLMQRKFNEAVIYLAVAVGIIVSAAAILTWGSGGHYLTHMTLNANAFYSFKILTINLLKIGPTIGGILVCGGVAAAALLLSRKASPVLIYFLISTPILLLLGKSGWGENHAIEPLAAACLAIGALLGSGACGPARKLLSSILLLVVAIQIGVCLPGRMWSPRQVRAGLETTENMMDEFMPILKSAKGPILAENIGLLIAADVPVWYQPYEFTQMTYSGKFDQEIILGELRDRHYAMIVVETNFFRVRRTDRFSPEFIQGVGANYKLVAVKNGRFFYLPKLS